MGEGENTPEGEEMQDKFNDLTLRSGGAMLSAGIKLPTAGVVPACSIVIQSNTALKPLPR